MNNAAPGRRNLAVAGVIVAVLALVVGIGWAVQSSRDSTGDAAKNPGESATEGATSAPVTAVDTYGIGVGSADAKAKVEIFEDFRCPHCADFEAASRDSLRGLAGDGAALVVYRPMAFLNKYSVLAMNAVGAVMDSGDMEAALDLHDLFFEQQPEGDDVPSADWFIEQAASVGADSPEVEAAIRDNEFEQWVVNGTDDASKRGVTGTPTVFVNGEQVLGASIEELAAETVKAIEAAQ
ncbi:DsbA family protein [Nocardioides alcanivorans]|uniref:DsbA family protein n=1 Tax=Nocardioides alcanivorans TaxID=2897352 RepID=UPI001F1D8DAE|nr:thioredoxin domain-containing protein [Nocardioides alcanivorans]